VENASSDPGAGRPDASGIPPSSEPVGAGSTSDEPPGLRAQVGRTFEAVKRLLRAHVDLGKAELAEIVDEVKRFAALAGAALALVLFAALLLAVGGILFLGEWIFGSIGWGVLLGALVFVDAAIVAMLMALGIRSGDLVRDAIPALVIGLIVGVGLGLDLSNRGWTLVGEAVLPTVDPGVRPLVTGVAAIAILGALVGLVARVRSGFGAAIGGLVAGAIVGAILGALTAAALGPRVGAAFGVLAFLVAWPALMATRVSRTGIDGEALKQKFIPDQTIETTKETIEWVRERMPLGRKS
jgi:hypothetical protein